MNADMFTSLASHKIIDHLYDDRKDFIILGLCGRVGSGVSTLSSILEMSFDEMQLPSPGYDERDPLGSREYRIIHTYASKNWHAFYKIRTSSLITRHILDYTEENFLNYITELYNKNLSEDDSKIIKSSTATFFNAMMECNWEHYYRYQLKDARTEIHSPWKLFEHDWPVADLEDSAKIASNKAECQTMEGIINLDKYSDMQADDMNKGNDPKSISFTYNPVTKKCYFSNKDLSKLLQKYAECRRNKSGFKNPFWIIALKQYLYDFLPREAAILWNKLQQVSHSLPTLALQCLGNNLRMNKQPYYLVQNSDWVPLRRDGYECLAEEINLAIKVLRAYQLILRVTKPEYDDDVKLSIYNDQHNQNIWNNPTPQEVRTAIVIDSIKNPYESLYLKARYSNYYLIGVYTEEIERHKRLREKEHFVHDDIKAIDIIENNSKLKKEIHAYMKHLKKKVEAEKHNIPEPPYSMPWIIQKLYNQFQERGLLENLQYISPFILQNVSSCLESADILINNIPDDNAYTYLKTTMLRYVSLIMNPGLVLPTPVERCMQIANTAKLNSGCISRQVGAVITDSEYHLLSIGWNQQPEGQIPCAYRDLCELHHHWDKSAYSEYENDDDDNFEKAIADQVNYFWDKGDSPLAPKGKLPVYCFKDYQNSINNEHNQIHTRALHGEETAFLNLGANSSRATNGILFTTSSPCELCAKKAKYMGISKIYYVETYAGVSRKHVLNIGKHQPELNLFTGAIGTAYTKLFTPLLPRKDENEMWLGAKMDHNLYKNNHGLWVGPDISHRLPEQTNTRTDSDQERGDSA